MPDGTSAFALAFAEFPQSELELPGSDQLVIHIHKESMECFWHQGTSHLLLMHTVHQSSHEISSDLTLLLVEIHSNLMASLPSLLPAMEYPR